MVKKFNKNLSQLEFNFEHVPEKDRNFHLGGKSFYFFDFDDNVAYLSTPIVIFHKETGAEKVLSSGQFAELSKEIGHSGHYQDYFIDLDDSKGSFRNFRDKKYGFIKKLQGKKQSFLVDIEKALKMKDYLWKAPSWNCFYHATFNQRPMSVITARGHQVKTIKDGIGLMVKDGYLPIHPNFLSIYPVSNPEIRKSLGDHELSASVPELKKNAIRESVESAIKKYGYSPHHRFGMSDDDPTNIELITEEMKSLKSTYPEMSFFVIQTFQDSFVKNEILLHKTRNVVSRLESQSPQLNLFDV